MDKRISIDAGQRAGQCCVVEEVDLAMREARFGSCWIPAAQTGYAPPFAEQASDDGCPDAGACPQVGLLRVEHGRPDADGGREVAATVR